MKTGISSLICIVVSVLISASLLMAQSGQITSKDQSATTAIANAKKALGGETNIEGVKSLVLTGTSKTRQQNGSNITNNFEIKILLPDNFLWINQPQFSIPGQGSISMYNGISNGEIISGAFVGTERMPQAKMDLKDQNAINAQLDGFARLLIGAILKSDPVAPINVSATSTPNKFSITTTRGTLCEIEFDSEDGYPSNILYKEVVSKPPQMSKDPKSGGMVIGPSGETETVDSFMRFKDRIAVEGILFPKTIIYESRGNIDRELQIEKIQINPKLSLKDFELPQ